MSFWDSLKKTLTCNDGIILDKIIEEKNNPVSVKYA